MKNPNSVMAEASKTSPVKVEDNDFEEGTIDIPLPSKGVFYHPPFRNTTELYVRPLDWRDEDILTTKAYMENGTVFDKLVTATIQTKGITAKHLVPVDRDTILLWLRSTAMGNDMTVSFNCPLCKKSTEASWDLSKLSIPKFDPKIEEELMTFGEITVVTPKLGLKVKIRTPTIGESNDTEKRLARKKENENSEVDFLGTGSILLMISGVEVEEGRILRNQNEIRNYFNKVLLPIKDSRFIRDKAISINLKYDTKQDVACKHCSHVVEGMEMPIVHPNFLWT